MSNIKPFFGHTGHTRITENTINADEFAASFMMSKDIHHKAFIEMTIKAAQALKYPKAAIALLTIINGYIREVDWKDGRPICFASNEKLAWDAQVSVSAIKKNLKELAIRGLISRTGDGNGKRTGGRYGRGPKQGHLREDTTGINLAPLAGLYHAHCEAAQGYVEAQIYMKTMTITARRFIRNIGQMKTECIGINIKQKIWEHIVLQAADIEKLIQNARNSRNLEAMEKLLGKISDLSQEFTAILKRKLAVLNSKKNTPQGGNLTPQIPITASSNSYGIIQANQEGCRNDSCENISAAEHAQTYTEHGSIHASEIMHLFPIMSEYFPTLRSAKTWESIERGIAPNVPYIINIRKELWAAAMEELPLGYPQIMFAITLDWISGPNGKPDRAGGYFMAMWRRYKTDDLHLFPTIMGKRKGLAA
jgi:hypothetical protein